jgi:type I restriction enzyme S subunit
MANEYVAEGIPFLRSLNVEPFAINPTDIEYISQEFHERLKKSSLHPGDVIVVRTGRTGACAVIPEWLPEANCSDLVIIRPGENLNPRFLMYYLNSAAIGHINAHLVGAVQQHFNVASAKQILLHLPSLAEQEAIAEMLGALDDKIELNRKMNATLDELARTIFRSWFVNFDPVCPKKEGREPFGMDAETSALFPDRLVESSLGPIPDGWEVERFTTLARVLGGGTPKTSVEEYWSGDIDIPWFAMADLPNTGSQFVIETEKQISAAGESRSSAKRVSKHSTILTARGTVGETVLAGVDMAFNQSCYGLQPANDAIGQFTLFLLTRSQVDTLRARAHGSVFATITRSTLDSLMISVPNSQIFSAFE